MRLSGVELLEERFDEGEVDLDLIWDDQAAGGDGMRLDVRSASLRKGTGSVLASASVAHGGALKGSVIASGLPLTRIDALGAAGSLFDGSVSLVASLGGTVSRMAGFADVHVSRVGIRRTHASLPPSRVELTIVPTERAPKIIGRTPICGNPQGAPFDLAEFERDLPDGSFVANGSLFGGQVALEGLRVTRQQRKIVDGQGAHGRARPRHAREPDPGRRVLGGDAEGHADRVARRRAAPARGLRSRRRSRSRSARSSSSGRARGSTSRPRAGRSASRATRSGCRSSASRRTPPRACPPRSPRPARSSGCSPRPTSTSRSGSSPTNLSRLSADIPQIRHARGTVQAEVQVTGPLQGLRYTGSATLKEGELDVVGAAACRSTTSTWRSRSAATRCASRGRPRGSARAR